MAKKKGSETSKKEKEYMQIYLNKGLTTGLQRYVDKYGGTGHTGVSKLVTSILQEWAREMAKTEPELFQDINLEEE